MKQLCDLHTHSAFSDGSMTPEELVNYAKARGAMAIALTDHDTIGGLSRAVSEGGRIGLQVIPGIELTTKMDECEIHMIGLFVDYKDEAFCRKIDEITATRSIRNEKMVGKLISAGFNISYDDLKRFTGPILTKAHIGEILVERGYASDLREAMNTYLRKGGIAYVERQCPDPATCIELIHKAGGLAFVAHTNQIDPGSRDHSCEICRTLLQLGADGLETRYCEFDDDWRRRTESIAVRYGKLRSGGSDYHGVFKKNLDLLTGYGDLEVPYQFLLDIESARG